PYRDMILAVQDKVQQMIAQGKTLQEVLAAKVTAPYDAKTAGGTGSSADRFVTAVYQELKSSTREESPAPAGNARPESPRACKRRPGTRGPRYESVCSRGTSDRKPYADEFPFT